MRLGKFGLHAQAPSIVGSWPFTAVPLLAIWSVDRTPHCAGAGAGGSLGNAAPFILFKLHCPGALAPVLPCGWAPTGGRAKPLINEKQQTEVPRRIRVGLAACTSRFSPLPRYIRPRAGERRVWWMVAMGGIGWPKSQVSELRSIDWQPFQN